MKYCSIWASIVFAGLLVALGITFRGHQTPFLWSATRAQYASAPSRVMTLQPTPLVPKRLGLTRLADFGVDFCDNYPPISDDEITLEIRDKLYAGFGMDGLDPNKCSSNNTSRPAVAWNFHEAGLGSNLKQIPNFILLTGLGQEFHLFLLSLTLPHAVAYRYRSFQAWYEQHFVLASIPGTTCHVYEAQCTTGDRCRTNSYWEDGIPRRGRYIIGYAGGFAHNFRTSHPKLYQELAVRLMREVLRMHRSSKVELDKKHKAVLNEYGHKFDKQIAMHVRRTDKLLREAEKVDSLVFVSALELVLNKDEFKGKQVLLHLMTDDPRVEQEFHEVWDKHELAKLVQINFRSAALRPDLAPVHQLTQAYYLVLLDLRLMASSDAFIGSQSSNMGVVTCLLRAHHHCYAVDKPAPYVWDAAQDPIT